MEVHRLGIFCVISCVLLPYLVAKSVSLNDIIAAESGLALKQDIATSTQKPKLPKSKGIASKSVSLNEIIAAESKQNIQWTHLVSTPPSGQDTLSSQRISLIKFLKQDPYKTLKQKISEKFPRKRKISALKSFKIKSPLNSRLKRIENPRQKRRNQSIKREIYRNERLNKKYVPLFRSLTVLFDNMLASDSGEVRDTKRKGSKQSEDDSKTECTCKHKASVKPKSSEETVASTTSRAKKTWTENPYPTTEIPSTTPFDVAIGHLSHFRPNTDLPLLPAGDTFSSRRDDSRLGKGNRPAHNTGIEGNIPWDNRNGERDTAHGEDGSRATDNAEDTDSTARDDASGDRFRGGRLRGRDHPRSPVYRGEAKKTKDVKTENRVGPPRGDISESERETQLEMGGDETESATAVPQFVPGFTGFVPAGETKLGPESLRSKEVYQESYFDVKNAVPGDKRIFNGNGAFAPEDKKVRQANAGVETKSATTVPQFVPGFTGFVPIGENKLGAESLRSEEEGGKRIFNGNGANPGVVSMSMSNKVFENSPRHKAPYVTIIDGYSVARDKNGANKLAEQSIRFYS